MQCKHALAVPVGPAPNKTSPNSSLSAGDYGYVWNSVTPCLILFLRDKVILKYKIKDCATWLTMIRRPILKTVRVCSPSQLISFKRWLLPCTTAATSIRRGKSQDVLSDSRGVLFDRFKITNYSPSGLRSYTLRALLSPTELASLRQTHPSLQDILKLTIEDMSSGGIPSEVDGLVALLQSCQEGKFQADGLAGVIGNSLVQRSKELSPHSLNKAVTCLNNLHEEQLANMLLLSSSKYLLRGKTPSLPNSVIMSLVTAGNLDLETKQLLGEYVVAKVPVLNVKFLIQLLASMLQHRCLPHPLLSATAGVVSNILDSNTERKVGINLGKLFWVFGKVRHHDEQLCASISNYIVNGNKDLFAPWMTTAIIWYFARVRYYDPEVMEVVAKYALAHVDKYAYRELSSLVYSFGYLNHHHSDLMSAVARRLAGESSVEGNEQTYWMFVWSSMVMDLPFPDVLSLVLTEDFIKGLFM